MFYALMLFMIWEYFCGKDVEDRATNNRMDYTIVKMPLLSVLLSMSAVVNFGWCISRKPISTYLNFL